MSWLLTGSSGPPSSQITAPIINVIAAPAAMPAILPPLGSLKDFVPAGFGSRWCPFLVTELFPTVSRFCLLSPFQTQLDTPDLIKYQYWNHVFSK